MLQKDIVYQNLQMEDQKFPTDDIQWLFIFVPKETGAPSVESTSSSMSISN